GKPGTENKGCRTALSGTHQLRELAAAIAVHPLAGEDSPPAPQRDRVDLSSQRSAEGASPDQAQCPAARVGPGWLEGGPDLALSPVP
ncbi:hypothetical protein H8959_002959, partial [Pygathrix nigripes]